MALVNVHSVTLAENPARFSDKLRFDIVLHVVALLKEDIAVRLVYVGSSDSTEYDQVLETVRVGPLRPGFNAFCFEAPPPAVARIPAKDVLGTTVLMLIFEYRTRVFLQIGYYVNNESAVGGAGGDGAAPVVPAAANIRRTVLTSHARPSRFAIDWD